MFNRTLTTFPPPTPCLMPATASSALSLFSLLSGSCSGQRRRATADAYVVGMANDSRSSSSSSSPDSPSFPPPSFLSSASSASASLQSTYLSTSPLSIPKSTPRQLPTTHASNLIPSTFDASLDPMPSSTFAASSSPAPAPPLGRFGSAFASRSLSRASLATLTVTFLLGELRAFQKPQRSSASAAEIRRGGREGE
eukprot:CAMPEP_0182459902 /NCGR_PEP_ID=MMETSP1319-20130603/4921_2 /TAXON_ID=172717 /ORGANISM="Bolidomonas pacifica, Strain RCC208" /LENGTH=195 /DNA_ID=CAMNT_0024658917 /DNA_START=93 /DNA_END=680 /DNA_ORIENTATION=-